MSKADEIRKLEQETFRPIYQEDGLIRAQTTKGDVIFERLTLRNGSEELRVSENYFQGNPEAVAELKAAHAEYRKAVGLTEDGWVNPPVEEPVYEQESETARVGENLSASTASQEAAGDAEAVKEDNSSLNAEKAAEVTPEPAKTTRKRTTKKK